MNKRRIGLAAAIGLGVTALIGAPQVTAQDEPLPDDATAEQVAGATGPGVVTYTGDGGVVTDGVRTAAGDSDIEFVALGSGCRVFDTRTAQGPLISGVQRTYSLKSGLIAGQGGKSGGCGIPSSAVAVDMSLSTLANSPTGTGFVRAGEGSSTPTATVLQFLRNQGTSVTTTVPMNASEQIRLLASGASAGMTGDVLGYWERPAHATVNSNGTLRRGSGVLSISKSSFDGGYVVKFERDVSKCTPVASGTTTPEVNATAVLNQPTTAPQDVFLYTRDGSGNGADLLSHLVMEC